MKVDFGKVAKLIAAEKPRVMLDTGCGGVTFLVNLLNLDGKFMELI
jgi:hypothetical protein